VSLFKTEQVRPWIPGGLAFVAREPHDKARAFPQLDGLPVGQLRGLTDRLLIVSTLDDGRRRGDVAVGRGDVDAVVRHGRLLAFQECKSLSHPGTAVGRMPDGVRLSMSAFAPTATV
jgi:hypothetical protein